MRRSAENNGLAVSLRRSAQTTDTGGHEIPIEPTAPSGRWRRRRRHRRKPDQEV